MEIVEAKLSSRNQMVLPKRARARGDEIVGVTEFETALSHYELVGLDAMAFIYHFEAHPLYSPLTTVLFQHIRDGSPSALVSVLVVGEVLTGPNRRALHA